ncbi:hypothetical protein OAU18_00925 [Schleiferiaceae bacterium]|nr:hypothetical protein [Schleiferiaceae bacterium]
MDGRQGYFYGLFTTNAVYDGFIRNAGFYDEPGALAFWGMYALLLNKLFVDNKKIEYLLLFGLISTLSLAYFIQVFMYLVFFQKMERKIVVTRVLIFSLVLFGVSVMSEGLSDAIFGRISIDNETGRFAGDNRSELFIRTYGLFLRAPFMGLGATHLITTISFQEGFVGGNFIFNMAADGVLGSLVTYLPLMYLFWLGKRRKEYTYAAIIILTGYLQRPYTDTVLLYPLSQYTLILFAHLECNKREFRRI